MPRRTDEKVKNSVMRKLQKYWGDIRIETDNIYECTFSSKSISAYAKSRYFSDEDVTALGSRFERLFFQPHFSLGVLAPSPADNVSQVRLSISLNADILKRLVDEMDDRHPLGDNPSPLKTDWFNDLWRQLEINCLNGQYRSPYSQLRNNRRGIPSGYLYSDVLIISPKDEGAAVFWPALLLEQRSHFLEPRNLLDWLNRYRSMYGEDEWRRILPPDRDERRGNAIEELGTVLTNECIKRCSPDSTEQLEAWRTDFMRYYKESFSILQLAEKHMDLLRDALTQWEEIERSHIINIFESIGRSDVEEANIGSEFDLWFSEVSLRRNDAENNATGAMRTAGQLLRGNFALGNLSWVEDLAVCLPQAVDKSLKVKVATHGRRVAALFFLEMFAKARGGHDPGIDNNVFNKCEAAWQLASYHGGLTP